MKPEKIFQKNKNLILLAGVFICFSIIFSPFLNVIAASIVTAYFAYPLFKKLQIKFNETFAVFVTWVVIFLVIIVPVLTISTITVSQVKSIIQDTQNSKVISTKTLTENKYFDWAKEYIEENEQSVQDIEREVIKKINSTGSIIIAKVGIILKGLPFLIIKIILYVFITTSLLVNGLKIKNLVQRILPLDSNTFEIFTEKIKYMTNGVMTGNFIIATIQAITTTISFILAGIPYAGIIFMISFLLYIPMIGTVILYIPASIYLIIKGHYIAALLIFLWNSVAVANIDNIFRGKFVPPEAEINNTLMFISVLSGVLLFGVMGVLYGPILAVIGVTSIKLYLDLKEQK